MPGSLQPVRKRNVKLAKHKRAAASVKPGDMLDALSGVVKGERSCVVKDEL